MKGEIMFSEYDDSMHSKGYIRIESIPDQDEVKDYIVDAVKAFNVKDNRKLSHCLEELCDIYNIKEKIVEQKQMTVIEDYQNTRKLCADLMQNPHYKKMGPEGVLAIVEKAKVIGISPLEALNGGMYYVQGKVELSAAMMNQLIRQYGHSITKDRKSDDTICILHGKRKDNGDTWTESFSIDEAIKAGIYQNTWKKYPRDMLFARALSRLARQLFPDVIKGCYVESEISASINAEIVTDEEESAPKTISEDEYKELIELLEGNDRLKENIIGHMKKTYNIDDLQKMPSKMVGASLNSARTFRVNKEKVI